MAALASRFISIFLTTIMVLGAMAPSASASSHADDALALLNAERAAAGLSPVAMHADLLDDAAAWSQHMYTQGSLSHNPNLGAVTSIWDKLGENVGLGTSITALNDAFMNSPSHRGNVLGDYDYVGIAVVEETSTKLWITVVFMKSLDATPVTVPTVDDPEPYADEQPPIANGQPVATEATPQVVAVKAAPAPQPKPKVVFVQTGVAPLAD